MQLALNMSLQVMGNIEAAAKVVLWTESRQPVQTWTAQMRGLITSLTFPGMVLDVKGIGERFIPRRCCKKFSFVFFLKLFSVAVAGGKTYDKDHVVIMLENDERPSQQWEIELL